MTGIGKGFNEQARDMAEVIDKYFNGKRPADDRVRFVLMVYTGDTKRVTYISNTRQDEMIAKLSDEFGRLKTRSYVEGYV